MDYKNNSNTGLIIVADSMLLSVEYIGNVHLFLNTPGSRKLPSIHKCNRTSLGGMSIICEC